MNLPGVFAILLVFVVAATCLFGPLGWLLPDSGVSAATQRLLRHLESFADRPV